MVVVTMTTKWRQVSGTVLHHFTNIYYALPEALKSI